MATVLLVRHGRTTANAAGTLAGWTPGVGLDDVGREQAGRLAERLAPLPLAALACSPLQRCVETLEPLLATPRPGPAGGRRGAGQWPTPVIDERLGECRYGDWTGSPLARLAKDPLWPVVQAHPSAVTFPGPAGESMAQMQARAVAVVREYDRAVDAEHGPHSLWALCSHGDVIKAVLADALGMHLDLFQRIVVDPCSVSVIRYTPLRPFVLRLNDTGDLAGLATRPRGRGRRRPSVSSNAVPGGGAGTPPG